MQVIRLTILLMLLPVLVPAQQTFSGKVVDAESGKPVSYASLRFKKQNKGANANEYGAFSIPAENEDTLVVSSVGYQSLDLPLVDWKQDHMIHLHRNDRVLKPVVVKMDWDYSDVGTFRVMANHYFSSQVNHYQVARRLKAPTSEAWLENIRVAAGNMDGKSRFILRVYDLDPVTGGPGQELTDSAIIVSSRGKMTTVDVKPYQVYLPHQEFFIALEWLLIPENERELNFGTKDGPPNKRMFYKPAVNFCQELMVGSTELWGLAPSGSWQPLYSPGKPGLAISARVRY